MPRGASASGSRRKSYSEGAQVRGDRARRVAVPLPRNLQDLEGQAARHFGLDKSSLGFHHRGGKKLRSDEHLSSLQAGDVIVAKGSKPRGPPLSTTFQSDYRPIKFEPPQRAPARPERAPVPFKGRSEYQTNFPGHTPAPTPRPAPRTPGPRVPFNSTSEYQTNFPGHAVQPATPQPRRDPGPAVPFEGSSTYRQSFPAHEIRTAPSSPARAPGPKVPFNGASTYHSDFPHHRVPPASPSPARPPPPPVPFVGSSEYRRNFPEHQVDVPKYVFIEPAVAA